MSGSAENGGSDEAAASASANASATAGGGPSGGGSADNPTVPPVAPALPTETLRSRNGTEIPVTIVPRTVGNKTKRSWVWQVYREFKPEINQKNVFCTLCQHLYFTVPSTKQALRQGGRGSPRRGRGQQSSSSSVQRESYASGGGHSGHVCYPTCMSQSVFGLGVECHC